MRRVAVFFCLMLAATAAQAANTFIFMENNGVAPNPPEQFVSSTPNANQTLSASPSEVTITFSSPLRAERSTIKVFDMYGTQFGDATTVNGMVMSLPLPPLASGRYAVRWRARFNDDNDLSDEFHFTIQ